MNKKLTIVIFIFSLCVLSIYGQNNAKDSLKCESYYDSTLQKEVYNTVERFPSFKGRQDMKCFYKLFFREFNKSGIIVTKEEFIANERIIIMAIINEKGFMENIKIKGKIEESDYSRIDKEVLRIINILSSEKWDAGICNNKEVCTLIYIYIPINLRLK